MTTWLHRIVVNACLDRLRRDRPTTALPERELPDRTDAHGQVETRLDVREALARLPEGQRMALVLVDMHGLSVAEAATILEVAEGTVKSRCARGRSALAVMFGPSSGGPGTFGTAVTSYFCQLRRPRVDALAHAGAQRGCSPCTADCRAASDCRTARRSTW